jgi:hypothetical protein
MSNKVIFQTPTILDLSSLTVFGLYVCVKDER